MKLYIVRGAMVYENSWIEEVFSSREVAEAYIEGREKEIHDEDSGTDEYFFITEKELKHAL